MKNFKRENLFENLSIWLRFQIVCVETERDESVQFSFFEITASLFKYDEIFWEFLISLIH
jgi:hypothetical protein